MNVDAIRAEIATRGRSDELVVRLYEARFARYVIFVDGVCGWIECRAADKAAARAYARDALGLRQLPRRHCVVVVSP